jgi:hypothetical protein
MTTSSPPGAPHSSARGAPATSAAALLRTASRSLEEAAAAVTPAQRYAAAHLAALRAAAAVLAARARPEPPGARRRAPRSVWSMLPAVAPELVEWAAFFAAGAGKRAAAEAGLAHAVTAREADDLLRDADAFLGVVERLLGLAAQPLLPTG